MTAREKQLLVILGIITGIALLILGSAWIQSTSNNNATMIKNNALQIGQLNLQINRTNADPKIWQKDQLYLEQLRAKKAKLSATAQTGKPMDPYAFAESIKTNLITTGIKIDQFQIDIPKKRLLVHGSGTTPAIINFLASLEKSERLVQTWSFSLDVPTAESQARQNTSFSIGLGYAQTEK